MPMVSRPPVIFLASLLLGSGCTQIRLDMRRPVPVQAGGMELIAVSGNAYQRGLQIGQAYAEELRRIIPTALLVEDQLEAEEMAAGEPSREDVLLLVSAQWPAEQRQEMAGIADGSGLKEADVLRYNTLAAIRQTWQTRKIKEATSHPANEYTLAPMLALESLWHPILLYRLDPSSTSAPATQPVYLGRHIEARQVGMVWPLWAVNRYGVFVIGWTPNRVIEETGSALWPMQKLAFQITNAANADKLMKQAGNYSADALRVDCDIREHGHVRYLLRAGAWKNHPDGEPPLPPYKNPFTFTMTILTTQIQIHTKNGPASSINLSFDKPLIGNGTNHQTEVQQP